ncbi:alcohol oxidase [Penicillium odoratum]|uniref:alcohol oxidase n=1 Tax=Penicillium odoratum TaxID=1167516 RepID=UPI002546A97D|nr:alcohol oxidase [Penicillium odoratum]KAJ5769680.1 alcohol oxidase [Penicillium odoratum]
METDVAQEVVDSETPPPDIELLNSENIDSDLDRRMRTVWGNFSKNFGTATMGTMVDTQY